ncbi:MAG: SoxR reducing system RseC family protein [Rhodocyclaceae bacterium]|nr:SoxR reducing system RseC family protein [Rhodocyclaceae bacterium]
MRSREIAAQADLGEATIKGCSSAAGNESEGVVTGVVGDFAEVEVAALPSACGKCGDKGGCGKPQAGPRRYAVRNAVGARVGDRVLLSVPHGAVLKAAMLSYLMPLVFVIGGAAVAAAWLGDGLPAVAGAVLGLAAGLVFLRILHTQLATRREPWLRLTLKR